MHTHTHKIVGTWERKMCLRVYTATVYLLSSLAAFSDCYWFTLKHKCNSVQIHHANLYNEKQKIQ
jgi:hypothetical protein